ncbi:unnamed protein product [Echinostoma caproni]|uniref:PX domain-containing protein n=1 Tax=Echinostoma caproni TaxID=27848 RepID=A0A183AMA5_9TREM|nr:unnamed protein product [Echinostoma caproni]
MARGWDTSNPALNQPTDRPNPDESGLSLQRIQNSVTNSGGWHLTPGGLTSEMNNASALSATNRFPEFCPIHLGWSRTMLQSTVNTSPRTSNAVQPQQLPVVLLPSLSSQQQTPGTPSDSGDNLLSGSSVDFVPMVVQVPRQSLCVLRFSHHRVTVFTYNWSKEEADRLSYRLSSLADWYNRRLKLLQCLSNQKLGLFHELNHPFARWCAGHATELIRNPCPPELLTYPDSILTGLTSRGLPVTPVSASLVGTAMRAYGTGVPGVGGASVVGGPVAGGSGSVGVGGGSGTRRRHPTSSGDFSSVVHLSASATAPNHLYSTSSGSPFASGVAFQADLNSAKNVANFLHLFQRNTPLRTSPIANKLAMHRGLVVLRKVDTDSTCFE